MSQLSKVRQSRTPWKHKATQRANQNRYQRKQLAQVKHERDRTATALKAAQARLRQFESQSQGLVARPKVDVVFLALQLFLVVRIGFRPVSRVLKLLAWALGIKIIRALRLFCRPVVGSRASSSTRCWRV